MILIWCVLLHNEGGRICILQKWKAVETITYISMDL